MRNILYVSGTRADYGLMKQTLGAIKNHPGLSLTIAATGMHLMPEFGSTIEEITRDGFSVFPIEARHRDDSRESMAEFLGIFIQKLSAYVTNKRPDMLLLLGDRAEMLGGAAVGSYAGIPVAHIHGGEVTRTVDEVTRHAITKLAHLHFAANKESKRRIIAMGEESWRSHWVGAPGLESIHGNGMPSFEVIAKKYQLERKSPLLIVMQHPVSEEYQKSAEQIKNTMEAVKGLGYQTIVIYPNADAGGRAMVKVIESYANEKTIRSHKTLPHEEFLALMKYASVLVGNSSSGIIEAPSFHLPAVNIGTRQQGRERGANVIDTDYDKSNIQRAIKKALFDTQFLAKVRKGKNPYYRPKTSERIASLLSSVPLDSRLLAKHLTS